MYTCFLKFNRILIRCFVNYDLVRIIKGVMREIKTGIITGESVKPLWFLYLIRTRSGMLYTGITTDVERRFLEHQTGGNKGARFLKGKGPLALEFSIEVGDHSTALKSEYKMKKLSKLKKEQIIITPQLFSTYLTFERS